MKPWTTLEAEWADAKAGPDWPAFRQKVASQFYRLLWKEAGTWYFRPGGAKLGSVDDCVSVASIGLMKAIDFFNPSHGAKFITYAVRTIRLTLSRISDDMGLIRVPTHVAADYRLGRKKGDYRHAYAKRAGNITSLEEWSERAIPEREPANEMPEEWERTRDAIRFLDPKSRDILKGRFFRGETLREIGERLGVSKERIQQLQAEAIRKLRAMLGVTI